MAVLKLVLDTNVIVDYLNMREPFFEAARKVMICGRIGEFELMAASSQFTDLVYILSEGGKKSKTEEALFRLKGLRSFTDVIQIGEDEVDAMLSSTWEDPEDFLLYDAAVREGADAFITRDKGAYKAGSIPVLDCDGLFDWLDEKFGVSYDEIEF